MNNKKWQNLALGLAFAVPIVGVYVGKRILSKRKKKTSGDIPEVTRIRIPISSLIGIQEGDSTPTSQKPPIVLPEDNSAGSDQEQDMMVETREHLYVASNERGKFHLHDCRWVENIKLENRLVFESRSDAVQRGFTPCGSCNP
jgi:hypothetical protein